MRKWQLLRLWQKLLKVDGMCADLLLPERNSHTGKGKTVNFFSVYISIPKDNCLAKMFSLHCGSLGATNKRLCLDFPSLFESVCFFPLYESKLHQYLYVDCSDDLVVVFKLLVTFRICIDTKAINKLTPITDICCMSLKRELLYFCHLDFEHVTCAGGIYVWCVHLPGYMMWYNEHRVCLCPLLSSF